MQTQSYELEGMAQSNTVLPSSNSSVMSQLSHMTVAMNAIQAQLNILSTATTNLTRTKIKFYCWIYGRNFTHGSKICSSNKTVHKEEAYYTKRLGGSKKGREWQLGAIVNKIEISNLKISLLNFIGTPPNYSSKTCQQSQTKVRIYT